ncbi:MULTISPECIES: hypothetical protein [unclassified Rhizobium]|uniref:hypothetical protein n=1 Tax=unclassified Rhizobium TaxID=2613769 RepID=UPI001ADBE4D5|nr:MULTISPECIES: hypothetical protein [unclassified Rhizobium]MBO9096651.1 hypothetical protein [Rhizobium sp. L58/93]MBO9136409.1 hypothetical protein [Rhizobium sp. B209b/85]MBO9166907.1 hypothetical protein [Rhizobium sp. L245/93]MBO9182879.1 hypothetical protein [Rhizobium sp. E27B/91]QXZ82642.1 hypothetical protein J5287_11080 [Rhizobium sp. K1/93]
MHAAELTMSEMLRDPMIRLMLRADRVPLRDFAKLLEDAANARTKGRQEDAQPLRTPLAH